MPLTVTYTVVPNPSGLATLHPEAIEHSYESLSVNSSLNSFTRISSKPLIETPLSLVTEAPYSLR